MKHLKWIILIACLKVLGGCVASERTGGNLGLAGYKSVEVAEVKVADNLPYAADKVESAVREGLRQNIESNLAWSKSAPPRALLTVQIIDIYEPSEIEQLGIGIPYQIKYVLSGRDADSGTALGAVYGNSKVRVRASILAEGSNAAFFDRQFERSWSDGTRQSAILNHLVVNLERDLDQARHRAPVIHPSPFIKQEPAPVQVRDQNNKGRLASSVPPKRS